MMSSVGSSALNMVKLLSSNSLNTCFACSNRLQISSGSDHDPLPNFIARKSCHRSTLASTPSRTVLRKPAENLTTALFCLASELESLELRRLTSRCDAGPDGTIGITSEGNCESALDNMLAMSSTFMSAPMSLNSASSIFLRTPSSICRMMCLHASECSPSKARANNCLCKLSIITCFVLSGCVSRRNLMSAGQVVAFTTNVRNAIPPVKNSTRFASCSSIAPPPRFTLT
mmetsp:Transcript_31682/g.91262  ORF Transcript_31682/g.91262 Transcript_31682/m.91262 type:complete len:230 (+) Transcript_31682:231-920(+)